MSEKKLSDFEKEYYSEINNYNVSEKDLVGAKVHPKSLAYEVYLRKFFGDGFAQKNAVDDYDAGAKRKVEKLTKEKLDNSEFSNIMSDIEQSEFDDNVEAIIHSKQD